MGEQTLCVVRGRYKNYTYIQGPRLVLYSSSAHNSEVPKFLVRNRAAFPPNNRARCCRYPGRNSFDTVLIPTQLVVDTCYATFAKLEADKLGEAETKNTWEQRLAMVASNRDADEEEQEAFVVSKYDLLPESLADMVQVSLGQPSLVRMNI